MKKSSYFSSFSIWKSLAVQKSNSFFYKLYPQSIKLYRLWNIFFYLELQTLWSLKKYPIQETLNLTTHADSSIGTIFFFFFFFAVPNFFLEWVQKFLFFGVHNSFSSFSLFWWSKKLVFWRGFKKNLGRVQYFFGGEGGPKRLF